VNKDRRTRILAIADRLVAIETELEILQDEEQDAKDAMPDSLQEGDKGEKMQAAIDALDEARNTTQELVDKLQEAAQ
jgi:hypothetical protein